MKINTKRSIIALFAAAILALPVFAAGEPDNVTGLSATAVDSVSIGLSWNSAQDAEGGLVSYYRIYYGTTSVQMAGEGDYDTEVDTPDNSTSYIVEGLTPDTTYYFSATAIDSDDVESEAYSIEASAITMAEEVGDTTSPTVVDVEAVDKSHVTIEFSEPVILPDLLPEAAFSITQQINPSSVLEILTAEIDAEDETGATVMLGTADQALNVNYIVTAGVAVTDEAGNPIVSGSADSGLFLGTDTEPVVDGAEGEGEEEPVVDSEPTEPVVDDTGETEDTTPPEDITDFVLSYIEQVETFMIAMNWTASINSAKDLVDQILYQSLDLGNTYDSGTSLGTTATSHEISDLEGGVEYTFKITTKDSAGNESVGAVQSIRLPQTGIGIGLLLLGSVAAAGGILRRKQK
ncbi:fibronectin type III domain-containing protein [Patescibacteria group bacterium]|nr:fibronectin type III domain-containing protein [Patescibacteria group bacterium]MBU1682501.1 fibronectin type III domain-containing protein [Patescibacteria group bacterium]MBU1935287.1 fibronectin type III domain-containing protein [Patescibacteria group bacterium]